MDNTTTVPRGIARPRLWDEALRQWQSPVVI